MTDWRAGTAATLALATSLGGCLSDAGEGDALALDAWEAQVELRIGSLDDPETSLTTVGTILEGTGGRFYVAQPQDRQVRIHAPDGTLLDRFGGLGEGPGEFQGVGNMGWWGEARDTLWVSDVQLSRVSLFLADGTFLRSIPLMVEPYREVMTVRGVQAVLRDGTALARPSLGAHLVADGTVTRIPTLRFDLEGTNGEPEPVVDIPAGNRQLALRFGQGMSFSTQPFADAPLQFVSGEAERLVVVERDAPRTSEEAAFRVTAITPDGDTAWRRTLPVDPLPLPRSEVDSIREERVETVYGFAERMGVTLREIRTQVEEQLYAPPFRPPVASGFLSPDGSVWLRMTVPPGEEVDRWWTLDRNGEPVATLELPDHLSLRSVEGDRGWAVETDEFDVPYVVRLRIGPKDG